MDVNATHGACLLKAESAAWARAESTKPDELALWVMMSTPPAYCFDLSILLLEFGRANKNESL